MWRRAHANNPFISNFCVSSQDRSEQRCTSKRSLFRAEHHSVGVRARDFGLETGLITIAGKYRTWHVLLGLTCQRSTPSRQLRRFPRYQQARGKNKQLDFQM